MLCRPTPQRLSSLTHRDTSLMHMQCRPMIPSASPPSLRPPPSLHHSAASLSCKDTPPTSTSWPCCCPKLCVSHYHALNLNSRPLAICSTTVASFPPRMVISYSVRCKILGASLHSLDSGSRTLAKVTFLSDVLVSLRGGYHNTSA